ncbi:MAG: hypothetical protein AUI88_02455 [Gemmatimonadetes bacterium 13_1_40CM_3_70_8]|nr:MAG: hypothetical protein AUI88_02455 [Gemmatimonadetes bacterium 13_1_40CM_3_70_8]
MLKASSNLGFRCATLTAVGLALAVTTAAAGPRPGARRAVNLFSGVLGRINGNRWDCGLDNFGHICVDPNGSTTVGGGFWPKGTPDQYVFGSGMQVAGIIANTAGLAWSNDTTAAFFEDPSGTHENGDKLSLIWNSSNTSDAANWPVNAFVPNDPSLYDPLLIGRKAASQQDTWQWYWDGNPNFNAGRKHPLGIVIDQRSMVWNFPSGNEDVIYIVFKFTNVSASDRAVYVAEGHPAAEADSLAALGARFKALNDAAFGVTIPTGGYTITKAFAAFDADMDVTDQAKQNYSSAFLPFNMGFAYKGTFFCSSCLFPPTIFSPPLAPTIGFVGVKYLKSPLKNPANPALGEVGLTMFSNTINGGQFDDARDATQVYRYLSANLSPAAGDAPCNITGDPNAKHVCFVTQSTDDIRFFQSSGPFDLAPGQSQTIVVAYMGAAPVDLPAIRNRSGSFDLKPGWPAQADSLRLGDTLRTVDRLMGATTPFLPDANSNGRVDQDEIVTVPRSLLNKGLVAQAVFDAKFLLPFPPDAPDFFLVPGDNSVTVVWRESASETGGDPYFQVAKDSLVAGSPNALFDHDYREFDVEGYRIYRGRTTGDLKVIAQFDKAGDFFVDYTGEVNYGNCAPELAVITDCPADLATGHQVPLAGALIQIPPGGRVKLADGSVLVTQADTAVTGGGSGNPPLADTGIPFAFLDNGVRNGFRYFYTVASFDVNSVKSVGPGSTSLESRLPAKTVTPRKASGQETGGGATISFASPRGTALNPSAPLPSIDPATGIFSGPMPPANGFDGGFPVEVGQLITTASATITIDSVVPGNPDPDALGTKAPAVYYVTPAGGSQIKIPITLSATSGDASGSAYAPATQVTGSKTARFGGDATFVLSLVATVKAPGPWRTTSPGRGSINDSPTNAPQNGPRWWTGAANENTPRPNELVCTPSDGACVQANLTRNAGSLPGVDIFHVQAYSTVNNFPQRDLEAILATVFRAADFKVYWGATTNGSAVIDSVIDVVHNAAVPFSPAVRASWGILDDSSFVGLDQTKTEDGSNAKLTWTDTYCVNPAPSFELQDNRGDPVCSVSAPLRNRAHLSPVAFAASVDTLSAGLAANGNGFIFYLNGNYFVMRMAALPTQGTVWNARFYAGNITGTGTAANYDFKPAAIRPPAVPGLRVLGSFSGTTFDSTAASGAQLAKVHTVPDPYYVTNAFEQSPNSKVLRFVNLPSECIIRIYSLSGVLVQVLPFHDATGGAETTWNLRNRNQQFVASGVYFYHVETPDGKSKIGRFTLVNFAQ